MIEYYNRRADRIFFLGCMNLLLGVIAALLAPSPPLSVLGSAALLLFMGHSMRKTPVVRLGADRIEVKLSPFVPRRIVAFGAIERVVFRAGRTIVLETAEGPVRIPAAALEMYQTTQILQALGDVG
jgi:hypothetical protein